MFIVKVYKKNKNSSKRFPCYNLVESIRINNNPKQKLILSLGNLDAFNFTKEDLTELAKRIESLLLGQMEMFNSNEQIEDLARTFSQRIIKNKAKPMTAEDSKEILNVKASSIEASDSRTIGAEYVGLSMWDELGLTEILRELEFKENEIDICKLLVIGRLVNPASELATTYWARKISALDELIGRNYSRLSKNILYEMSDKLYANKEIIEEKLSKKEQNLFKLEEKIILYDLTNTYFEGMCEKNPKAKFGRSKEKRNDCRIITVGMVVDGEGFPKFSNFYDGNIAEIKTFEETLNDLVVKRKDKKDVPTVVMDAGIASEDNLNLIKEKGYKYIVVKRGGIPKEIEENEPFEEIIKEEKEKNIKIEVKRYDINEEIYLYCKSSQKEVKEKSMLGKIENLFVENMNNLKESIKKGTIKALEKINQKIGRIKEKYSRISYYYDIEVKENENKEVEIIFTKNEEKKKKIEGTYILRTNRTDLSNEGIWNLYRTLGAIETSFKSLKSELGMRPNYHQLGHRAEGHIFISILAYHLLHSIETRLKSKKDNRTWETIRTILSTQTRITISLNKTDGEGYHLRICTTAEEEHRKIYKNLSLKEIPLEKKIYRYKKRL
jgi:transposase